jgi:hypothetical protein
MTVPVLWFTSHRLSQSGGYCPPEFAQIEELGAISKENEARDSGMAVAFLYGVRTRFVCALGLNLQETSSAKLD